MYVESPSSQTMAAQYRGRQAELLSPQQDQSGTMPAATSTSSSSSADSVLISEAARALFEQNSLEAMEAGKKGLAALSATTSLGTNISVQAKSSGRLRMGGAFGSGAFGMAGQDQASSTEYTVSFTKPDGSTQEFDIKGSARFYQLADGSVSLSKGDGTDGGGQAIIVNLEESGMVEGTKNDDVILNMARKATVKGGDGNDRIISMGDGADIDGGAGDDAISVLEESFHLKKSPLPSEEKNKSSTAGLFPAGSVSTDQKEKVQRPKDSQSVQVHGGEGNDAIESKVTLFESLLDGGEGDDFIDMSSVLLSNIKGGKGSDQIVASEVISSMVHGNEGSDLIKINTLMDSVVDAGAGNDMVHVGNMFSSRIYGGDGDDAIKVDNLNSMKGPNGEEFLQKSVISGGNGNDAILVGVTGQPSSGIAQDKIHISGDDGEDIIVITGQNNSVDKPRVSPSDAGIQQSTINVHKGDALQASNARHLSLRV